MEYDSKNILEHNYEVLKDHYLKVHHQNWSLTEEEFRFLYSANEFTGCLYRWGRQYIDKTEGKKSAWIRCGKCFNCKKFETKQWIWRLHKQAQYTDLDKQWFFTLTYNDENIPFQEYADTETGEIRTTHTVHIKHLQAWLKRARDAHEKARKGGLCTTKFQYFAISEYGEKTQRPHYHALIYGVARQEAERLALNWEHGFTKFSPMNIKRIAYTTNYLFKKGYNTPYGAEEISRLMSRNIGIEYVEKHKQYHLDNNDIEVVTISGKKMLMPRRFGHMIFGKSLYQKLVSRYIDEKIPQAEQELYHSFLRERKKKNRTSLRNKMNHLQFNNADKILNPINNSRKL